MERRTHKRKVATVGTYDGLHRGHRRVISYMKELAAKRGLDPLVITFDRHPRHIVDPSNAPRLLMHPMERDRKLRMLGLPVLTLEFTPSMASLTASEWLHRMHVEQGVDLLVLGHDNKFGCDGRKMSLADYRQLGARLGVEVVEAPVEEGISSTVIRRLVNDGKIEEAARLLGHPFTLTGIVEAGKHLGATIGFPTANIRPFPHSIVPKPGVYAVEVEIDETQTAAGVCNIGYQPTVATEAPLRIEVHLIDTDAGNLYGHTLRVGFITRLRDEMHFDSIDALKCQIRSDITQAQSLLPTSPQNDQNSPNKLM